jgi:cytochrome P450
MLALAGSRECEESHNFGTHAVNVRAPSLFVPPRPAAPPEELGLYRFLVAARTNALQIWSKSAYEQDVVVGSALGRTRLLINAPDAIHRVLVENTANYCRTSATIRILRPIVGKGLFLSEGEDWRHQRRTIAPAMAPRVVPVIARHVALATEETIAQLAAVAARGPVDVLATVQFLALEIAARSMFSLEMRQYGAALRRFITRFAANLGRPYFLDLMLPAAIPTLRDFARMRFRAQWIAFMDEIIAVRLREPKADQALWSKPRDLFDMLLAARDPETGEAFSRAQLRDQMATMIVAGHETTALTLFWSLYLLASSPADQERVANEVRSIDLAPDAAADALTKLAYTKAVVNESLRLYPPAFAIARMAIGPDRLGDVAVPRGALVMISPWVLQRHLRLWKDPDAFDPGRFLADAALPHRFAYMPFGAGPRICIGAQFALTEACLVLAMMVQRFHVALADARPVLPTAVIVTQPDHAAPFRLRPRNELR